MVLHTQIISGGKQFLLKIYFIVPEGKCVLHSVRSAALQEQHKK